MFNDLKGYVDTLESNILGNDSLSANKKRLIDAISTTERELEESEKATKTALSQIDELVLQASGVAFTLQEGVRSDVNSANLWTWIGMIIATIIAVLVAIVTVNRITKPLAEVNRILDIVASGDMTQRLDDSAKDEFGELSKSCNTLIDSLRSLITGIISRSTQLAAASEQTSTITGESSKAISNQQAQVEHGQYLQGRCHPSLRLVPDFLRLDRHHSCWHLRYPLLVAEHRQRTDLLPNQRF